MNFKPCRSRVVDTEYIPIQNMLNYSDAVQITQLCTAAFIDVSDDKLKVSTPDGLKTVVRGSVIIRVPGTRYQYDLLMPGQFEAQYEDVSE